MDPNLIFSVALASPWTRCQRICVRDRITHRRLWRCVSRTHRMLTEPGPTAPQIKAVLSLLAAYLKLRLNSCSSGVCKPMDWEFQTREIGFPRNGINPGNPLTYLTPKLWRSTPGSGLQSFHPSVQTLTIQTIPSRGKHARLCFLFCQMMYFKKTEKTGLLCGGCSVCLFFSEIWLLRADTLLKPL